MSFEMASQGDGRKRRSFLPAPKKAAGVSPTSPQTSLSTTDIPQLQQRASLLPSSEIPSSETIFSLVPSSTNAEHTKASPQKSPNAGSTRGEKHIDELAFGVGLRVGAKVRIGGIKPGILRYLGTTHLAPGIFCGIELSEPDGNHDGEVNGHRYFFCARNHGIFAPKEKVCLDSSSALGRLASDSDVCYSSTESLSERTKKAFKTFEEGELEAIDCTKLSPILSPQEVSFHDRGTLKRHSRSSKLPEKTSLSSACGAELKLSSFESRELSEEPNRKAQSLLPKAAKSNLLTSSSNSKLPPFSSIYKYGDGYLFNQRSLVSNHTDDVPAPSIDAVAKKQNHPIGLDAHQEHDTSSHRIRTDSTKSVEESEEDGFVRDTLSTVVKKQLRADSRQYLNFTFDEDELIQTVDPEDSESEISLQVKNLSHKGDDAIDPLYNSHVREDILADFSYDSRGAVAASSPRIDDLIKQDDFMKIESGTVVLREDLQQAVKSQSYTVSQNEISHSLDLNASSSETEEDGVGLSLTCSISDSDLPPDMLPRVDNETAEGLQGGVSSEDERIYEGGYESKSSEDGVSDTLNLTQNLDVHQSESYTISRDQGSSCFNQSKSYTVCTNDPEGKRDSSKRERDNSIVASQSYIISKTDSAASSPCRKYRKISTSSSANEGGDSSSSGTETKTDSSGEIKGDNLDDSSTGASPEVSQALEWDYGQEFDGKIPLSHQDAMTTSTSTGTSESLSDVLRDVSEQSDGLFEGDAPSSLMEDSDQFETPDNEFENIDSIEDFPIFGKDSVTVMTDSGISDKDFDFCPNKSSSSTVCGNSSDECSREDDASSHTTTRAISSDSSQETLAAEYVADTPGSVEDKDFLSDDVCTTIHTDDIEDSGRRDSFGDGNSNSPASVVSVEDVSSLQDRTLVGDDLNDDNDRIFSSHEDVSSSTDCSLAIETVISPSRAPDQTVITKQSNCESNSYDSDGRMLKRRERPVSLLSTTSADTGYVPDSDSELGTLTTNSPNTDWLDRLGVSHPTSYAPVERSLVDASGVCGIGYQRGQQGTSDAASSVLIHQAAVKTSDDDDYSSDLTTNTEDDRIEADQVYAHWAQDFKPRSDAAMDVTIHVAILGKDPQENNASSGPSDQFEELNLTFSIVKEEGVDKMEKKETNRDESVHERRSRARKPAAVTKKRSENLDHKMPNTNVTSRLANYIKAPTPVKPKDDKEKEPKKKMNKNVKNSLQKHISVVDTSSKLKLDTSRTSSVDRTSNKRDESVETHKTEKPDKPKPIIKRTPPKSKWGNIMSQIEASKDIVKPKLKSEIKSALASYLSTPPPQYLPVTSESISVTVNTVHTNQTTNLPKREVKSKLRQLPPPPPKIDFSKIKSKLNVPTAASVVKMAPKREHSPSAAKVKNASRTSRVSPGRYGETACNKDTDDRKRMSNGSIVLMRLPVKDNVSSSKNTLTDISVCDSTESIVGSQTVEGEFISCYSI